ncbi:hypothetical protein chiPu_0026874, partial [Chiloscyllium punctatum]|nr:hypothetical protein [Chiloscyllium punctatum]
MLPGTCSRDLFTQHPPLLPGEQGRDIGSEPGSVGP